MRLKRSYKNLRWEEAVAVYSMRHDLNMSFHEFVEEQFKDESFINWDEFEEITKDVRHFDLKLGGSKFQYDIKLSQPERIMLLEKFGEKP